MSDYSKLKQLAEASIQAWEKHSKADSHEFHDAWCKADTEFSAAAREEVVLALIADLERHQRMLLAAACDIGAIGQAMGADSEDDGSDLEGLAAELRKDAERYRWLRDPVRVDWEDITGELIVGQAEGEDILWMMSLDAAIDAAMDVEVTP